MGNGLLNYIRINKLEYYKNIDIKSYLTIGIGGKVRGIIIVRKKEDLMELIMLLERDKHCFVVIGGGSNIVFSNYSPDLFVIINRTDLIEIISDREILVNSGISNRKLLDWCKINCYCGLEFLAGIPGTIGGAAAVNAGAFGISMSNVIKQSEVYYSKAGSKISGVDDFGFQYRNSVFKYGKNTILSLYLIVEKCSKEKVSDQISVILKKRGKKHPNYKNKSAGCFFKNPIIKGKKLSAGKLIEQSGLKGKEFSKVMISDLHSNFIINTDNADYNDILDAEKTIIKQIKKKTGIKLEREVIYILSNGEKV